MFNIKPRAPSFASYVAVKHSAWFSTWIQNEFGREHDFQAAMGLSVRLLQTARHDKIDNQKKRSCEFERDLRTFGATSFVDVEWEATNYKHLRCVSLSVSVYPSCFPVDKQIHCNRIRYISCNMRPLSAMFDVQETGMIVAVDCIDLFVKSIDGWYENPCSWR